MAEIKKIYEIAQTSLEGLKQAIEDGKLDGPEAVEFVEAYKADINEMLDTKIEKLKTDFDAMIKAEREWEWAQEMRAEQEVTDDED